MSSQGGSYLTGSWGKTIGTCEVCGHQQYEQYQTHHQWCHHIKLLHSVVELLEDRVRELEAHTKGR